MRLCELRIALDIPPGHEGPNVDALSGNTDTFEIWQPSDIDQHAWRRQPESKHRHQALPTRDHLGIAAMNRERGNRLGQRSRANIVQRRKLHGLICYFSIAENT